MNSWQTLLLLDVARGRCIAKRQATEQERVALWMLARDVDAYNELLRTVAVNCGWALDDWDRCRSLL